MLAKRKIVYVVPPEQAVLDALDDYEALGGMAPEGVNAQEWRAERERLLAILDAATVEEWRFTLSTVTIAGQGRYNAALRRFNAWHAAQYGKTPLEALTEANKAPESDAAQETIALWNASLAWASIYSSLSAVETRSRPILAEDAPWQEAEGVDWADYATFEVTVPGDLAIALSRAAEALNPGLWTVGVESDEKKRKRGGVRASASALH